MKFLKQIQLTTLALQFVLVSGSLQASARDEGDMASAPPTVSACNNASASETQITTQYGALLRISENGDYEYDYRPLLETTFFQQAPVGTVIPDYYVRMPKDVETKFLILPEIKKTSSGVEITGAPFKRAQILAETDKGGMFIRRLKRLEGKNEYSPIEDPAYFPARVVNQPEYRNLEQGQPMEDYAVFEMPIEQRLREGTNVVVIKKRCIISATAKILKADSLYNQPTTTLQFKVVQ